VGTRVLVGEVTWRVSRLGDPSSLSSSEERQEDMTKIRDVESKKMIDNRAATAAATAQRRANRTQSRANAATNRPTNPGLYPKPVVPRAKLTPGPVSKPPVGTKRTKGGY
jgi:hypothetical protein